jgi:hypothetical protein
VANLDDPLVAAVPKAWLYSDVFGYYYRFMSVSDSEPRSQSIRKDMMRIVVYLETFRISSDCPGNVSMLEQTSVCRVQDRRRERFVVEQDCRVTSNNF